MTSLSLDHIPHLPSYQLIICGGGIAGVCAAVTAARQGIKTLLVEGMGCLGGTATQGLVPQILDSDNKGGMIREIMDALETMGMTAPRDGIFHDAQGKRRPGTLMDVEALKCYLDQLCLDAGVDVMLHSHVVHANMEGKRIRSILIGSETGLYAATADLFADATGSGTLSRLAGCEYAFGTPDSGLPQPCSVSMQVTGLPFEKSTMGTAEKNAYGAMLARHGIEISGTQACAIRLPAKENWLLGVNFEYGVRPDDIFSLSRATIHGRRECFETVRRHAQISGFHDIWLSDTSEHIGIREGLRIMGHYCLSLDDILSGRTFDDGICTVAYNIDIHKLHAADTVSTSRGQCISPYEIPYRCLIARDAENLFLAGKLISGDFYAFSSYRVMGNMGATGEAAGYAAALCSQKNCLPHQINGEQIKQYMMNQGYFFQRTD